MKLWKCLGLRRSFLTVSISSSSLPLSSQLRNGFIGETIQTCLQAVKPWRSAVQSLRGRRGPHSERVNARSRTGEKAFERAWKLLTSMGVRITASFALSDPARLSETVHETVTGGHDPIILGGGDGSVSSSVDFLAGHHSTLGLLPLGTANDFARTLEIPSPLEAACETIANGKVVDVDLGLAGNNYYVNVASAGLGVEATRSLSPRLKNSIGPLAYPVAAITAFSSTSPSSPGSHSPTGTTSRRSTADCCRWPSAMGGSTAEGWSSPRDPG